jgi:hypothetical protein
VGKPQLLETEPFKTNAGQYTLQAGENPVIGKRAQPYGFPALSAQTRSATMRKPGLAASRLPSYQYQTKTRTVTVRFL